MPERIVLRAELFHESRRIVAHTTEVGAGSVFVRTDERVALGAQVLLRLSFPRLFAPLQITAQVASRDAGSGHGYYPGFMLEFPTDERLARLQRQSHEAPPTGSCRMLVVEDSAVMRDIVEQSASAFSRTFQIITESADCAESALALMTRESFDLAIVDLYLPGRLNGADLVRDLRARKLDLPVIGFSVGGTKARLAFLEAGADMFLDKPIMLRDVFTTLERLLVVGRRET
jgi:CheY-like chemotaxis protein